MRGAQAWAYFTMAPGPRSAACEKAPVAAWISPARDRRFVSGNPTSLAVLPAAVVGTGWSRRAASFLTEIGSYLTRPRGLMSGARKPDTRCRRNLSRRRNTLPPRDGVAVFPNGLSAGIKPRPLGSLRGTMELRIVPKRSPSVGAAHAVGRSKAAMAEVVGSPLCRHHGRNLAGSPAGDRTVRMICSIPPQSEKFLLGRRCRCAGLQRRDDAE